MSTATGFITLIEELFETSEALLAHIQTAAEGTEYDDSFIEKIQELINARQSTIEQLENEALQQNVVLKSFIDSEVPKEKSMHLIVMETEIASGLKVVIGNIQNNRQLLQKKRNSRQQYRNPFASVERDGMFVDKRK